MRYFVATFYFNDYGGGGSECESYLIKCKNFPSKYKLGSFGTSQSGRFQIAYLSGIIEVTKEDAIHFCEGKEQLDEATEIVNWSYEKEDSIDQKALKEK